MEAITADALLNAGVETQLSEPLLTELQVNGECTNCVALNILKCEVGFWKAQHRQAKEREAKLHQEIEALKAKISLRERQLFGRRSERNATQSEKGDGSGIDTGRRKRGQQRGTEGHGRRLHKDLPSVDKYFDLADGAKVCSCCGLPFEQLSETSNSEEVVIEVKAHRRVIRRRQYKPRCQCPTNAGIVIADGPAKLIPKGSLSVSVWTKLLLDKFLFQRPSCRLLLELRLTLGLNISQGTVTDGMKRLGPIFEPLYEVIVSRNSSESLWHADETGWKVFEQVEGKQGNKWYLWVFRSQSTVVYVLDPSRSSAVPQAHFGQDAQGIIVADRYISYKVLLKGGKLLIAFCWAHVRRDFLAIAKDWGQQHESWAFDWLTQIAGLYQLNKARLLVKDSRKSFAKANAQLRKAITKMANERDTQLADQDLHPARRKVLESLERHWSGLTLFVKYPQVPMDNNEAERRMRNPVLGRKSYYGSGSVWSGMLAQMLLSLFQTLLLWEINPHIWLTDYLQYCADCGSKAPDNAASTLPWNLSKAQLDRYRNLSTQRCDS